MYLIVMIWPMHVQLAATHRTQKYRKVRAGMSIVFFVSRGEARRRPLPQRKTQSITRGHKSKAKMVPKRGLEPPLPCEN
jgi:hypothetical protein